MLWPGYIGADELLEACIDRDINVTSADVDEFIAQADGDKDGMLSLPEWLAELRPKRA